MKMKSEKMVMQDQNKTIMMQTTMEMKLFRTLEDLRKDYNFKTTDELLKYLIDMHMAKKGFLS